MAAEPRRARERRPAIWPWLLMPLLVLVVFCTLLRVHHRPGTPWAGAWGHAAATARDPGAAPAR